MQNARDPVFGAQVPLAQFLLARSLCGARVVQRDFLAQPKPVVARSGRVGLERADAVGDRWRTHQQPGGGCLAQQGFGGARADAEAGRHKVRVAVGQPDRARTGAVPQMQHHPLALGRQAAQVALTASDGDAVRAFAEGHGGLQKDAALPRPR